MSFRLGHICAIKSLTPPHSAPQTLMMGHNTPTCIAQFICPLFPFPLHLAPRSDMEDPGPPQSDRLWCGRSTSRVRVAMATLKVDNSPVGCIVWVIPLWAICHLIRWFKVTACARWGLKECFHVYNWGLSLSMLVIKITLFWKLSLLQNPFNHSESLNNLDFFLLFARLWEPQLNSHEIKSRTNKQC